MKADETLKTYIYCCILEPATILEITAVVGEGKQSITFVIQNIKAWFATC
jgi:hypothetical protein